MFYITHLDDDTSLVLEAETSGAFAKSDLEVKPNPTKALINAVATARTFARFLANELGPTLKETGAEADITFSIKADSQGMVMIGMKPGEGQIHCSLKFGGGTRAAAPATSPPPAALPAVELPGEPTYDEPVTDQ